MKKIISLLCVISLIFSSLIVYVSAVDYKSNLYDAYSVAGLRNQDGSLVKGINYTPSFAGGWFANSMTEWQFRPQEFDREMKDIRAMGFNSIRILPVIYEALYTLSDSEFNKYLSEYESRYRTFFDLCRENGLTVDVIMLWGRPWTYDANYSAKGSKTERVIDMYINKLGPDYEDVIVMWEIVNEPDLDTYGRSHSDGAQMFANDTTWNNYSKPFIAWAKEKIDSYNTDILISVGYIDAPMYDSFDANNTDVINFHEYDRTISDIEREIKYAIELDKATLGYIRPIALTEVANAGLSQPLSDVMAYCEANNIAYYVWAYSSVANEQNNQGIVDNLNRIRPSAAPLSIITDVSRLYPFSASLYDRTYGTGNSFWEYMNLYNSLSTNKEYSVESIYNWVRYLVPYYTEDYAVVREKLGSADEVLKSAAKMALPYIRTYGTYANDNALGGSANANYYENITKLNGMANTENIYRARSAFGEGVDNSKAIIMQVANELIINNKSDGGCYSFEVEINPTDNARAGVIIMCDDGTASTATKGVYAMITSASSDDVSDSSYVSARFPSYKLMIYRVDESGNRVDETWYDLQESDFDAKGYTNLKVDYSGMGTTSSPFNATIYVNGVQKATYNTTALNQENNFINKYVALVNNECFATYFDDVKLSKNGKVILSDSFEAINVDNDLLTYTPGDNSKIVNLFNEISKDVVINLTTPKITSIAVVDGKLNISWDYSGSGENAFEIWRSTDNGLTWKPYWRTAPGEKSAIIPTGNNYALDSYKVAPVNSNNVAVCFSNSQIIENPAPYARYTFDDQTNIGEDVRGNYNLVNGDGNQANGYEVKSVVINGNNTAYFSADNWDKSLVNYDGAYFDSLNEFTISVKAKIESFPDGVATFVSTGWDDVGGFTFGVNNVNEMFFDSRLTNGNTVWVSKAINFDLTKDFHEYTLVVTNDKKTISFYFDGSLIHTQDFNVSLTLVNVHSDARNRFVMGQVWWQGGYKFKGWMDCVNIYNTGLSNNEVSQLYNYGGISNKKTEPVAKYSFEKSADFGLDSLGNAHLTQNGTGITQVDGAYGKAAKFDGTTNLSAGQTTFQNLSDYTISFFASVQQTGDFWRTTVQNGSKLKVYLRADNYIIIHDADGEWLSYYDMNAIGVNVADMHHYAVSVSVTDNTITTFVDGVQVHVTYNADKLDASNGWNVFSIGGVSDIGGYHNESLEAIIDEVNVYNGALNATQVAELYNSYDGEVVPDVPETNTPDAFYKFDSENIGKDETGKYDFTYDSQNLFRVPSMVSTGGAVEFLGTSGWKEDLYIENNFTKNYTNFTVSCQLKLYELFGDTNLSIVSTGWDDQGGFTFGLNNWGGSYYIFFDGKDAAGNSVYTSGVISKEILNEWHSYSLVVSGGGKVVSLYCDSDLIATTTSSSPLKMAREDSNNLVIGNYWWRSGSYQKLTGEMDNLCFYNKALSIGEIAEVTGLTEISTVGDANDDGAIDVRDLVNSKKHIVAGNDYLAKYDCNKDFNLNAYDLVMLRQYILGLVFDFGRM